MIQESNNSVIRSLKEQPGFWAGKGPNNDMVLSSRVRIARNMASIPFPGRMSPADVATIRRAIEEFSSESTFKNSVLLELSGLKGDEKRYLRERNIITYEMENSENSMVLINHDNDFVIMVNEEDHFRIQVMNPGLCLPDCWALADRVDDELNAFAPYAFSVDYGYLSSSPANLGTGLKLSAILHLPLISLKKKYPLLAPRLKKAGVELQGTLGEGNRPLGSLYHLSSRISMGLSEAETIDLTNGLIHRVISLEDSLRDESMSRERSELEDRTYRSLGLIKYARKITYGEALEHLSNIRLGIILAIIRHGDIASVTDMMVRIQWFHLQDEAGKIFTDSTECDEFRAEYLRNNYAIMESRYV